MFLMLYLHPQTARYLMSETLGLCMDSWQVRHFQSSARLGTPRSSLRDLVRHPQALTYVPTFPVSRIPSDPQKEREGRVCRKSGFRFTIN